MRRSDRSVFPFLHDEAVAFLRRLVDVMLHVGLESFARKQTDTPTTQKRNGGCPKTTTCQMAASHGPTFVHPDEQEEINGPARHYRAADLEINENILAEAVVENPQAAEDLFGLAGLSLAARDGFWYTEDKAIEREHEAQMLPQSRASEAGDVAGQAGEAPGAEGDRRYGPEWHNPVRFGRTLPAVCRRLLSAVCTTVSAPLVAAGT